MRTVADNEVSSEGVLRICHQDIRLALAVTQRAPLRALQ